MVTVVGVASVRAARRLVWLTAPIAPVAIAVSAYGAHRWALMFDYADSTGQSGAGSGADLGMWGGGLILGVAGFVIALVAFVRYLIALNRLCSAVPGSVDPTGFLWRVRSGWAQLAIYASLLALMAGGLLLVALPIWDMPGPADPPHLPSIGESLIPSALALVGAGSAIAAGATLLYGLRRTSTSD